MTTYTLAIADSALLLATVPDGGDIAAAVTTEAATARIDVPEYAIVTGCTLIDGELQDGGYVWHSGKGGWISDENGRIWDYAVRAGA